MNTIMTNCTDFVNKIRTIRINPLFVLHPFNPVNPLLKIHPFNPVNPLLKIIMAVLLIVSCSYDEELTLCELRVQLAYQKTSFGEPEGVRVRVELKDQNAQIFVDSTGTDRTVHFLVPPGIYEASTNAVYVDSTQEDWWRYVFNGIRSQIVVSPDSLNQVEMEVKVTRKLVVH